MLCGQFSHCSEGWNFSLVQVSQCLVSSLKTIFFQAPTHPDNGGSAHDYGLCLLCHWRYRSMTVILSQVLKILILDKHVGPTLRRSSFLKIMLDQHCEDLQDPLQAWRASSWSRGRFPRRRSPCSPSPWSLSRSSSPSSSQGDSLSFYLSILPHQATPFFQPRFKVYKTK